MAWVRGSWTLWAALLPLAPIPRPPVTYDVHRIAEAIARWDREAGGGVAPLASGSGEGRPPAPRTHRTPDT